MTTMSVSPDMLMSLPVRGSHELGSAEEEMLAGTSLSLESNRSRWQWLLDTHLVEWGRDRLSLEDDGIIPPSERAIQSASRIALWARDSKIVAPTRAVPNGDGGITFELESDQRFEAIEIQEDGTGEIVIYEDGKISFRQILPQIP